MKHRTTAAAILTGLLLLCSCAPQAGPSNGSRSARLQMSHPGLATSQAVFLKLYRGTPDGLLVSGLFPDAPVDPDRNPGTAVHGLTFTPDPSVHGAYFWKFDDAVTLLDGTCQKTGRAGLLASAARPGGISVQFISFLYADQRPWAPPAIHVFSRALGEPQNCTNTVLADPAFAQSHP